jgi:hypothetical protein
MARRMYPVSILRRLRPAPLHALPTPRAVQYASFDMYPANANAVLTARKMHVNATWAPRPAEQTTAPPPLRADVSGVYRSESREYALTAI